MSNRAFQSLLIANRGEIACRIIKTARRMGLRTIAVYSDADRAARHVRLADEAVHIGPAAARESYLSTPALLAACKSTGAEALHPGYGFLSENADFAEAVTAAGVIFVGPTAASIRAMGSKSSAKALMVKADVPVTPGYHGDDQDPAHLATEAARIGFPVLIKATAGGGGKGMRRVDRADDFAAALASCQREAASSFGDDKVLIEKYVERPRHVEVQVFGDTHGHHVHLFERDCSVQRRHQKVLEEAPAPDLPAEMRTQMGATAVLAARTVNYVGAGTVELIVDPSGHFYFMEMNTRLQVEHPVTEEITGLDLVEWQLRVAAGEPLPLTQEQITHRGHAIEARVYAENPDAGFAPSVGPLAYLAPPATWDEGPRAVRVDTGVEQGDAITASYDPMIAKLIVRGADRAEALRLMSDALAAYQVVGVTTNLEWLGRLVRTRSFTAPELDTSLIEREHEALQPPPAELPDDVLRLAALAEIADRWHEAAAKEPGSPWSRLDGFRLSGASAHVLTLRAASSAAAGSDERREVRAEHVGRATYRLSPGPVLARITGTRDHAVSAEIDGRALHGTVVPVGTRRHVFLGGRKWELELVDPLYLETSSTAADGGLRAPMSGKIVKHLESPGATVAKGAPLLVMEAMKMEMTLFAPHAGVLASYRYAPGEQVAEGEELAIVEAASKETK
jgi:3-methylcrotonyl-CoA carboxylase alpha subunit